MSNTSSRSTNGNDGRRPAQHIAYWVMVLTVLVVLGGMLLGYQRFQAYRRQRPSISQTLPSRWISVSVSEKFPAGLTERDFNQIKQTIPTIERAVLERHSVAVVIHGGVSREVRVCATLPEMQYLLETANFEITDGRFLNNKDGEYGHPVCVVTHELAKQMFPDDNAIDATLAIGDRELNIIGVLAKHRDALFKIDHDLYFDLRPQLEPVPPTPVKQSDHKYPTLPLNRIWLEVGDLSEVDSTKQTLEKLLERNHPGARYAVRSGREPEQRMPQ